MPEPLPGHPPSSARLWLGIAAAAIAAVVVAVVLLVVVRPADPGYDDATRQRFLDACTAEGGDAVAGTCGCLYDRMAADLPFERFEAVDELLAAETVEAGQPLALPADVQALLDACLAEGAA